jgi:hypothetical protein
MNSANSTNGQMDPGPPLRTRRRTLIAVKVALAVYTVGFVVFASAAYDGFTETRDVKTEAFSRDETPSHAERSRPAAAPAKPRPKVPPPAGEVEPTLTQAAEPVTETSPEPVIEAPRPVVGPGAPTRPTKSVRDGKRPRAAVRQP